MASLTPLGIGLRFEPPTVVVEYREAGSDKLFHLKVSLKRLQSTSDAGAVVAKLRQRYPVFRHANVPEDRLRRLVQKAVDHLRGIDESTDSGPLSPAAASAAATAPQARGGLFGALRDRRRTAQPTNPESDKEPDSRPPAAASYGRGTFVTADGHEDVSDGDESQYSVSSDGAGRGVRAAAPAAAAPPAASTGSKSLLPDVDDLQKVSQASLQVAKAKMNVVFEQNRLKPGDEGYVYNVVAEFDPEEPSEWDE